MPRMSMTECSHRLMFHLCREAASKTLLAEEDFQLGEQLEEAWEDEEE